jgi:hypothetical protein
MDLGTPELIVGAIVLALGLVGLVLTRRWHEHTFGRDGYKRMSVFSWARKTAKPADPIAEADVYLAYGRRDRAIAILEDALRTNQQDYALQKRLLEIKTEGEDV